VSNAVAVLLGVVWLSLASLVGLKISQLSPKRRKPVDELEAADAALRLRLVDLEDKFEHHLKRDAVRLGREKRETQQDLPGIVTPGINDRVSRLEILRQKVAAQRRSNNGIAQ